MRSEQLCKYVMVYDGVCMDKPDNGLEVES